MSGAGHSENKQSDTARGSSWQMDEANLLKEGGTEDSHDQTPARKRKADTEPTPTQRKVDTKKVKTTYTPRTQARQLRKSAVNPGKQITNMAKSEENGPVLKKDMKGLSLIHI